MQLLLPQGGFRRTGRWESLCLGEQGGKWAARAHHVRPNSREVAGDKHQDKVQWGLPSQNGCSAHQEEPLSPIETTTMDYEEIYE